MDDSNGVDKDLESKLTKTILKLEEIDPNLYRANYLWETETRGVFGGQIIGQSLVAADHTVPPDVHVHSMHCYFLLSGDGTKPIVYHVDNVRDGKSFSTRIVKAVQNGKLIFTAMMSYHVDEPSPTCHQYQMPDVPPPESLPLYEDLLLEALKDNKVSDYQRTFIHNYLARDLTFQLKPVDKTSLGFFRPSFPKIPKLVFWIKLKGNIGGTKHNVHRCVATYISDSYLLSTSLLPIYRDKYYPSMMVSLDHSLWFHAPFRVDEWMLYECESPRYVGSRGLALGRIWNRDGTLAISVAQEGLVRLQSML